MLVSIKVAVQETQISERVIRNLIKAGKLKTIRPTERTTRIDLNQLKRLAFEPKEKK